MRVMRRSVARTPKSATAPPVRDAAEGRTITFHEVGAAHMTTTTLPSSAEIAERLQTWIERYRVAGAAVAWMRGDEIQSAAAGVINTATPLHTTPDTVFQIGSITKVYTTTLIMQ